MNGCRPEKNMFRELEDAVQIAAASVLSKFSRLVGERKLRTSADPFVLAVAQVEQSQIVTDEKPTGNIHRPNIPDVCAALGMFNCVIGRSCWKFTIQCNQFGES
jgi:hypothetical protein